jgi:hypothetical protein
MRDTREMEFLFWLLIALIFLTAIKRLLQAIAKIVEDREASLAKRRADPVKTFQDLPNYVPSWKSRERKGGSSGFTGGNRFAFQEEGKEPQTDSAGRVIVKLKGAADGIRYRVSNYSEIQTAKKLAGKGEEFDEFAKSVKARVRADKGSPYENSFKVETLNGEQIGWIFKDHSSDAASVFGQMSSAIIKTAPELAGRELTFEVSLRVEGGWIWSTNDDDSEEWEPDLELLEIRIMSPASMEINGNNSISKDERVSPLRVIPAVDTTPSTKISKTREGICSNCNFEVGEGAVACLNCNSWLSAG